MIAGSGNLARKRLWRQRSERSQLVDGAVPIFAENWRAGGERDGNEWVIVAALPMRAYLTGHAETGEMFESVTNREHIGCRV